MTPADGVAWGEPPEVPDKPDWKRLAKLLRKNPGRWRLVYENGPNSWRTAVAMNKITAVRRDLGYEIRTTDNKREAPRTCTLYMRYNPDFDESRKKKP